MTNTIKKIMLVPFSLALLFSASYAYAEGNVSFDYDVSDIEEIETERYKSIEGKWQVDIEIDGDDHRLYVYNIDDEDELVGEVTDAINDKFDFDLTDSWVEEILEIESDEFEKDKEDSESDDKDSEKDDDSDSDEDKEEKETKTSLSDKERDERILALQEQITLLLELVLKLLNAQLAS